MLNIFGYILVIIRKKQSLNSFIFAAVSFAGGPCGHFTPDKEAAVPADHIGSSGDGRVKPGITFFRVTCLNRETYSQ